jgi:hypothetical protein
VNGGRCTSRCSTGSGQARSRRTSEYRLHIIVVNPHRGGLAVFSLPPGAKRAGPGWQRRCTSDPAALARTWPDGANIGVGCRASGVVGLDLDRHDGGPDGIAAFAALCRLYAQPWPDTLTVATPHSGPHLYFRVPPGLAAASAISRWPGIDIRAPATEPAATWPGPDRSWTASRTSSSTAIPRWSRRRQRPRRDHPGHSHDQLWSLR